MEDFYVEGYESVGDNEQARVLTLNKLSLQRDKLGSSVNLRLKLAMTFFLLSTVVSPSSNKNTPVLSLNWLWKAPIKHEH